MSEYEYDTYGNKVWLEDGLLHRDDGPAIEWADGNKEWWLNGKEYTKEEYVLLQFSRGVVIDE